VLCKAILYNFAPIFLVLNRKTLYLTTKALFFNVLIFNIFLLHKPLIPQAYVPLIRDDDVICQLYAQRSHTGAYLLCGAQIGARRFQLAAGVVVCQYDAGAGTLGRYSGYNAYVAYGLVHAAYAQPVPALQPVAATQAQHQHFFAPQQCVFGTYAANHSSCSIAAFYQWAL